MVMKHDIPLFGASHMYLGRLEWTRAENLQTRLSFLNQKDVVFLGSNETGQCSINLHFILPIVSERVSTTSRLANGVLMS